MKFHEYRTLRTWLGETDPNIQSMSNQQFYECVIAYNKRGHSGFAKYNGILTGEMNWVRELRPFYHVYPAVIESLSNTSLHITPSQIGVMPCTAICFPVGKEPVIENGKVSVLLFGVYRAMLQLETNTILSNPGVFCVANRINHNGNRAFTIISGGANDRSLHESKDNLSADKCKLLSLAIGIALLARDPRFAEPILLQRDVGKTFATPEDKQRAIDRAIRNGRNGMTIGKDIDVSPHCRRPHFGIRWTEKGHSVPRLVPINGCLVNRSKLFPIPTGYLVEEENSDSVAITSATSSASAPADPTLIEQP